MTGSSCLPVSINKKGELVFLFGKENPMEDSSKGFSDFGGSIEKGENIYQTALRECAEELSFFLGDANTIDKLIHKNGGVYKFQSVGTDYHIHIFFLEYDENLPKYYNANHLHLWDKMDKNVLNNSKFFEKIEIQWMTCSSIKHKIKDFRSFYQNIILDVLTQKSNIKKFISKKKHSKTYKK